MRSGEACSHPPPPGEGEEEEGGRRMDTVTKQRATSTAQRDISKQDFRAWLAMLEAAGEVTHVSGAEREEEIGGIVDIYQRTTGAPAVLFDDVPGYPNGYRVIANILTSVRRINMTLGLPSDGNEMDLVRY